MTLDLPVPPHLQERLTQLIVKLYDFGFARATASPGEIYTGKCETATASPGEIFTGNCKLCDFGFARATASLVEIYTGNCEALRLWICPRQRLSGRDLHRQL